MHRRQAQTAGRSAAKNDVEDSASAATEGGDNKPSTPTSDRIDYRKKKRDFGPSKGSDARVGDASSSNSKALGKTFTEGESALLSYGLSVSGRKERILSPIKGDKFFHMIEQAWSELIQVKPDLLNRFSYAEFKHASALMLYQRLEHVKSEGIGVVPPANVRIPLPRNLRVFQPIWSILSDIGIVSDDDNRVMYIPDGVLPLTEGLTDPLDIEGLVTCTLYDWASSWDDVQRARARRPEYDIRIGYQDNADTNETPDAHRDFIGEILEIRRLRKEAVEMERNPDYTVVNGVLQKVQYELDDNRLPIRGADGQFIRARPEAYIHLDGYRTVANLDAELTDLHTRARRVKKEKTTLKWDLHREPQQYVMVDGIVDSDPGARGAWLHWDPRLWVEYEQMVEMLGPMCLFSLSMPVETTGTYAWLLPVETREEVDNSVFCKLPKASIPPVTWIKAMLMQTSTLPQVHRSTWYCETDTLSNILGLRQKYIRAGIKRAAPTEQYGTY